MYTRHFTHDRLSRWVYRMCRWVCRHARHRRDSLPILAAPEVTAS
jgi:hypothetical protein